MLTTLLIRIYLLHPFFPKSNYLISKIVTQFQFKSIHTQFNKIKFTDLNYQIDEF